MVLRCSLLGHDYGDPQVEREREERGSEVVVTVQEYEECSRCGDRNVLSENTEVRSLSGTSADAATPHRSDPEHESTVNDQPHAMDAGQPEPGGGGGDVGAGTGAGTSAEPASPSDGTDAEILDDDASDSVTIPDAEILDDDASDSVTIPDAETNDPVEARADPADPADAVDDSVSADHPTDDEPVTDDGEILEPEDGSAGDGDRDPGAWPDSSDVGPPVESDDEPTTWPDPEADAAGAEAEVGTGANAGSADSDGETDPATDEPADDEQTDAVVLEHTDPTETGADAIATDSEIVDAGPSGGSDSGSSPDASDAPNVGSGSGIERADSIPTPGETAARRTDDVPTEFYCPRCEFVEPDDRGSLRPGDICPDCRKGYLGERPVQ